MCEVQGYVYAALRAGAVLAGALDDFHWATRLNASKRKTFGSNLNRRSGSKTWGPMRMALDGDKRPCRVRSSNAGQCLFTGIAAPDRAARVARGLLTPESFSGWGVRTLAATEATIQPNGLP